MNLSKTIDQSHAAALRPFLGKQVVDFELRPNGILLRFGYGRELIVDGDNLQVHHVGPLPRTWR